MKLLMNSQFELYNKMVLLRVDMNYPIKRKHIKGRRIIEVC